MLIEPEDQAQRTESLDITQSFIVQAPAGSGKTSLLTQRFLRLLAKVNNPEEILAITFTRKAAAEMHERIISALKLAQKPCPRDEFDAQTWRMAAEALQHDADMQWHLLQNPGRLRVQTIDSLCASLTKKLPVTARFGSPPAIQQDASSLYTQAARNCLEEIEDKGELGDAIRLLLAHVDNHLPRAEGLLSVMLASRDQWLRHIMNEPSGAFERTTLEGVLQRSIESVLINVEKELSEAQFSELNALLGFSSGHIADVNGALFEHGEHADFNDTTAENLAVWQMLTEFLLTKSGDWRKQANAALGFPAPSGTKDKAEKALWSEQKARYKAFLGELSENDELLEALVWMRCLPSAQYSEQQWAFIQALSVLLPVAVAELKWVFQQQGHVDFCEVALSAGYALQDSEGMTDVGLRLDYQLQHILVDEFQDTSETQFMLLRDLVVGWQPDDGRTLFLVGDPMQSIYRFRQAEVGLFLKTQQEGLGEVTAIKPLHISVNFRSQAGLVEWVNGAFKSVMPVDDNLYSGAISYKPSAPFKPGLCEDPVSFYPFESRPEEGEGLLALIQGIQKNQPNDTIGVLVRGRKSLLDLVKALNHAGVAFQASDIDPLAERQTVIDLMSLTRAFLHPADRIAWLSVLRAPWCGLSLNDLYALLEDSPDDNVWDVLCDPARVLGLSAEGQQSVTHVSHAMADAFAHRDRLSVVDIIEGLWSALLAPECLSSASDFADAQRFFDCLSALESEGQGVNIVVLTERVEKLYAAADVGAPETLQIMTIHKAKGLEFDHVILPGLERQARQDDKRLLSWLERPAERPGESELLIAPIKEVGSEGDDSIGDYLRKIEQQKSLHESQRLLYVAVTRAKKQLHLSFCVSFDEKKNDIKKPSSSSLLGLLWSHINASVSIEFSNDKEDDEINVTTCKLKRIDLSSIEIPSLGHLDFKQAKGVDFKQQTSLVEFDWATDLAASVGTVCHHLIQIMGESNVSCIEGFDPEVIRRLLQEAGVLPASLNSAVDRVVKILSNCLHDKRGQWVLNNSHEDSAFELALSGVVNGKLTEGRLDRTFVDDDVRWIIDYKSSRHDDNETKDVFLDNEVTRYTSQLERYAALMTAIDSRPIMLGLYYPEFGGWRSWAYVGTAT